MRLFVALFPPADVVAHLRHHLAGADGLIAPGRWHITLNFLGDVDDLPAVEHALDTVPRREPITLRLRGGGSFRRTVAWAGVEGPLDGLHADIRTALAGLPHDERPYTPHLTLSYRRPVDALTGYAGPAWTADHFVLVHSRDGYHRLRTYGF